LILKTCIDLSNYFKKYIKPNIWKQIELMFNNNVIEKEQKDLTIHKLKMFI